MKEIHSPSAQILRDLISCPSVTPEEGGALSVLEVRLKTLGFVVERVTFSDSDTPDIENLYARRGTQAPNFCFAGHTDVVPVGTAADWKHDAFSGAIEDGFMFGRGAVDMKGGIACFVAAVEAFLQNNPDPKGSISLLITGDEEGPAINGTIKLLEWAKARGETLDACIVGEPTNHNQLGDTIKIGRRGSLSGTITVNGVQGHAAYPHLADNPVRGMMALLTPLLASPFDNGTDNFEPTNLEVTSVDVGNPAVNVVAASATASFNARFNDTWTADTLQSEIIRRLDEGAASGVFRKGRDKVDYALEWRDRPSHVFLTKDEKLIKTLSTSVEAITGRKPELGTGGGTSDARFIKDYCPVVEFGLVGQTMHQVDERVALADLETLTEIYQRFLQDYFA